MALDFAKAPGSGDTYPKRSFEGQEDQSYGFVDAFKLQTGNTRGTQTVGFGGAKIDGANNRIVITNPGDGSSVGMGSIPDSTTNEYGFFSLDENGRVIMKIVLGTWYVNDPDVGLNVMQSGILPDNTIGWAVAGDGKDVEDGFT